jgi:hypothetical protein
MPVGTGLMRPECVLALHDGSLACSDARGGVQIIGQDGQQRFVGGHKGLIPNGIVALSDNGYLVANVGTEGGVWRLGPDGHASRLEIMHRGCPLPEVNFVHVDTQGRLWVCLSSLGTQDPVFSPDANEGSILVNAGSGFREVANGLGWTNELRVSADGSRLFVNETFGRRLNEFEVAPDGALSNRKVLVQFGAGDYPDGLALDHDGGIWVVSIISNRIYRVDGAECSLVFSDNNAELIARLEALFLGPGLRRSDLHGITTGQRVNNISSIAFGGPDMRNCYLGSLSGSQLWSFRAPVAGATLSVSASWPLSSHP